MNLEFLKTPSVQLAGGLLIVTLLLDILIRRVLARTAIEKETENAGTPEAPPWRRWLQAVSAPLSLIVWYYGLYAAARILLDYLLPPRFGWVDDWLGNLSGAGAFIGVVWLLYRVARVIEIQLSATAAASPGRLDDVLLPLIGAALRMLVPVTALFFLVRLWPLESHTLQTINKLIAVVFISAFAWLVLQAVKLTEHVLTSSKELRATTNYNGRAFVTRISVLRKILMVLIIVFALSAILMLFDEVRDIGRSILASAGIAGIILGFAAQRSLGGLFAGLQIALTQPIRLGDQVKVSDIVGIVEEITLTFVVLRIWDQRRMVVPISHFIENSVINYTRMSSAQTGFVLLRADFTLPVPEFRKHLEDLVKKSPLWDKKNFAVQVTDAQHESMELRIICGANTPGDAFNLQCEVREAALDFIHRRYPQCLPKAREEGKPIKGWGESEELLPRDFEAARASASAAAAQPKDVRSPQRT